METRSTGLLDCARICGVVGAEEQIRMLDLHPIGNAARDPVADPLGADFLGIAEAFRELGRASEGFDKGFVVGHGIPPENMETPSLNTTFKQKSNIAFNNAQEQRLKIDAMNEQMQRLYQAANELKGITGQSDVARALNVSPQTVNNWEARGVSKQGMLDAERLIGCSALWIETGDGTMGSTATETRAEYSSPGDTRLPIRRALFKLAAGVSGYEIEYENGESEPIFMGRRWFESNHYRPEKLIAVKVTGRSMEPNLHDGDLVVINTEDVTPKDGIVFAANYDGELVIKRLKRDAGQWFLGSDNPDKARFGDKLCADGCGLIGKIIYKQSEQI